MRVNEDLRRSEARIGPELELVYFHVLATIQQYQRLKLTHERQTSTIQQPRKLECHPSTPLKWVPNMENIIQSLDKMSFARTAAAIQSLLEKKRYYDVIHPLLAFKVDSALLYVYVQRIYIHYLYTVSAYTQYILDIF